MSLETKPNIGGKCCFCVEYDQQQTSLDNIEPQIFLFFHLWHNFTILKTSYFSQKLELSHLSELKLSLSNVALKI